MNLYNDGNSVDRQTNSSHRFLIAIEAIQEVLASKGHQDCVLFSFGGGGGGFCAEVGTALGVKVYTFAHSSVFSAMGLSTADVVHSYEQAAQKPLAKAVEAINKAVAGFQEAAVRDMHGEGFAAENIRITVELEVSDQQATRVVTLTGLQLQSKSDIEAVQQAFGATDGQPQVDVVRVKDAGTIPHPPGRSCVRGQRSQGSA